MSGGALNSTPTPIPTPPLPLSYATAITSLLLALAEETVTGNRWVIYYHATAPDYTCSASLATRVTVIIGTPV